MGSSDEARESATQGPTQDQDEISRRARRLRTGRSAPKAGRALGDLGAPAMPLLREALTNANPFVRSGALHGLEAAAVQGQDVVDDVARALGADADPRVQETACLVLGRLGAAAVARARPAVEAASKSSDARVKAAADGALAVR